MKDKLKRLFNGTFNVLKLIGLLIVALSVGILTWWPILSIGIIVAGLVAFLSVTAAWIVFCIIFCFVLIVLLVQLFNPRIL